MGKPPESMRPSRMPRSARLVAQLAWNWSPMNCCIERYHLSMNREHNSWLLWLEVYDDNWGKWLEPRVAAYAVRQGVKARSAALAFLRKVWSEDRPSKELGRFSEVTEEGLLSDVDLIRVAEQLWPECD